MTNTTWAGRSATPPMQEDNDRSGAWVPIAGVLVALGLVGAGGYLLGSSGGDTAEAAVPSTTEAPVAATFAEDETATSAEATQADTGAAADGAVDESAADGDTDGAVAADDSAADESGTRDGAANQVIIEEGQVRGALLRDGVLYLGGVVPSQDVADQIIERAEAVIGEGNVVSEYVIDPSAEMGEGAPLYIEDVVLFAYGANTYDPQFEPLLDLGLALLSQNPSVTVTIVTHTDASGSASYNNRLSYERGQSVAQYWVDRGIPVEQIVIDARGENDPRVDESTHDAAAQLNRRAEFYIEGLLP